eukprot:7517179-Alexandrium_andersonii.AAC.1
MKLLHVPLLQIAGLASGDTVRREIGLMHEVAAPKPVPWAGCAMPARAQRACNCRATARSHLAWELF